MKKQPEIKKFCLCKIRLRGVCEDNFGIQECGDCGFLLRKQPSYCNFEQLKFRIKHTPHQ